VRDLVNFLVYVGEPAAQSRKMIGVVVLFVLGVLFTLAYAMKKAYLERRALAPLHRLFGPGPGRRRPPGFFIRIPASMMQLYSGTTCPFSHRCRFVLYEKGMDFQVIDVDLYNKPEDMAVMNPYNRLPVLVERDLVPLRVEHHQRVHRRALPPSAN
jgi:glutaredoxin